MFLVDCIVNYKTAIITKQMTGSTQIGPRFDLFARVHLFIDLYCFGHAVIYFYLFRNRKLLERELNALKHYSYGKINTSRNSPTATPPPSPKKKKQQPESRPVLLPLIFMSFLVHF